MRIMTVICLAVFVAVTAQAQTKPAPETQKPATKETAKPAAAGAVGAPDQKGQVERGQKLYADNKCQACHSIGGKPHTRLPLDDVGSRLSAEDLRQWLINPAEMTGKTKSTKKPPMPSFAKLAKEDVSALVAYLQTLKKKS